MEKSVSRRKSNSKIIHSVIGVAIMIFFQLLPLNLPNVTSTGMQVLGIFIGTIYLWTTVDPLWSSLLSVVILGFSSYGTMSEVLAQYLGSSVVVQLFFIMAFVAALVYYKVTLHIGHFFLTRKFTNGRPWLFTFVILLGSFLLSAFVNCFAPIFLFWPIMYDVFEEVGFKKGAKYPKLMVILIVVSALLGFPVAPYMQNSLALLSNYRKITEGKVFINDGLFFIFAFTMGILMLAVLVLFTKYVLHPDVTPLKTLKVEDLEKNPLPPMDFTQKVLFISFIVYIFAMLLPTLLSGIPFMKYISTTSIGFATLFVALLTAVMVDGKPIVDFGKIMEKDFAWTTFFLCATAILLGSVLTNKSTGITAFLNTILSPIFKGMSGITFTIVLLITAVILTNLCNSLVIGMILQPVVMTYCAVSGVNAAPIITLLISFVLLSAAVTPAASPFAAMLFSNTEWLKPSDIYKYSGIYVFIELVLILLIGIPFVNVLM